MGCDIHLYQEKHIHGKWIAADEWIIDPRYPRDGIGVAYEKKLYTGRNYRLFSVLANVRNGYGFAGIKTGDAVLPIAQPRGIPKDACPEYKAECESWGANGHSHSWITLDDLINYKWPRVANNGVVRLDIWREWKRNGTEQPKEWSGDVTGPNIQIITAEVAAQYDKPDPDARIYVSCRWYTNRRDDCADFLNVAIPRFQELEKECGKGNARLVFFFDN